jgi:hypothetical protein
MEECIGPVLVVLAVAFQLVQAARKHKLEQARRRDMQPRPAAPEPEPLEEVEEVEPLEEEVFEPAEAFEPPPPLVRRLEPPPPREPEPPPVRLPDLEGAAAAAIAAAEGLTSAPSRRSTPGTPRRRPRVRLTPGTLGYAILASEILGPPLSMRRP